MSRARSVNKPGSPGPAPTKKTVPFTSEPSLSNKLNCRAEGEKHGKRPMEYGKWTMVRRFLTVAILYLPLAIFLLPCSSPCSQTCSRQALVTVSEAADCLDHRDSGCAKLKLEPVLQQEPDCAEALFIQSW